MRHRPALHASGMRHSQHAQHEVQHSRATINDTKSIGSVQSSLAHAHIDEGISKLPVHAVSPCMAHGVVLEEGQLHVIKETSDKKCMDRDSYGAQVGGWESVALVASQDRPKGRGCGLGEADAVSLTQHSSHNIYVNLFSQT